MFGPLVNCFWFFWLLCHLINYSEAKVINLTYYLTKKIRKTILEASELGLLRLSHRPAIRRWDQMSGVWSAKIPFECGRKSQIGAGRHQDLCENLHQIQTGHRLPEVLRHYLRWMSGNIGHDAGNPGIQYVQCRRKVQQSASEMSHKTGLPITVFNVNYSW